MNGGGFRTIATAPKTLSFNFLSKGPNTATCGSCLEEDGGASDATTTTSRVKGPFVQYDIDDNIGRVCWRVTCVNSVKGHTFKDSLLGPTGHIERMNVWTHLFGAAIYALYLLVRNVAVGRDHSLSNTLINVDGACLIVTFLVSSAYHVASANRFWSAVMRIGDYAGIYLGIAAGYLADLSLSTLNLAGVPWQAVADLWVAMAVMIVFFVVRRIQVPIDDTRMPYLSERCSIGLARSTNVDLDHSSLRAAAGSVMAFSWILTVPGALSTLEPDCGAAFVISHALGTLLLVAGMVLDNVVLYPDTHLPKNAAQRARLPCFCYNASEGIGGGWIFTSHAFWHVIATLSIVATSIGMEYIISTSRVLAPSPPTPAD